MPTDPADKAREGRGIDVLLVEDDPADAGLVRIALKSFGSRFALSHVTSLAEALRRLEGQGCDVVLLDLSLPDSMGLDTIRHMREAAPAVPLVVLTGHDDEDFAVKAMAAGTQDYLFKGETDGPSLKRAIRYAIARKRMEEQLRQSEQRLHNVIALAQDAIVVADGQHRITLFNPAAERMFGYHAEDILGHPLNRLIPIRFHASHDGLMDSFKGSAPMAQAADGRPEVTGVTADGREFPVEVSISKEVGEGGVLLTAVIRDVTERRRFENELLRLATTDSLTGLSNRRHFLETAGRELTRLRRYGRPATVLMLDVDHFKRINDTHGHAEGDEALKTVAAVCRRELRDSDLTGRLGGEEFGVLLTETALPEALEVAERLRAALARIRIPVTEISRAGAAEAHLTVSIGVSPCVVQDASIEQSLGRADRALYRAKERGRDRVETEAASGAPAVPLEEGALT